MGRGSMTCIEFQEVLPDIMEGERNAEHTAHLQSCSVCSGLVSDLSLISEQARLLQASEEPSPRVWDRIEIALRQEGLIRQPGRDRSLVAPAFSRRWSPAWLLPVAAILVIAFGVLVYKSGPSQQQVANKAVATPVGTPLAGNNGDDQQLLEVVAARTPSMRASYEANLQNVNAYIRDAEQTVQNDPNDEEAQRSLMAAYEQKAMVYEMALNRSLP
jgi:hypothetical protein